VSRRSRLLALWIPTSMDARCALTSQNLTLRCEFFTMQLDYTHRLRWGEGGEYPQEGWPKVNPPFHLPKEVR